MNLYLVDTNVGCGIREAETEEGARVAILTEIGTMNQVRSIRKATVKDIVYVRAMSGWLPKSAIALLKTERFNT